LHKSGGCREDFYLGSFARIARSDATQRTNVFLRRQNHPHHRRLPAGDAYDIYARLLATYMGKHIPGNPNIMVQNMPGASSMIAANYVYNVAKPDGLTLGSTLPSLYFDQLLGRKEVKFDWRKFT
jgi:hypothetical protein